MVALNVPVVPTTVSVMSTDANENAAADENTEPQRGTYLSRMVDPTDEQLDMIDSIVAVHQERASDLDKAHRQEMRGILAETRESIMSVLDADRAAEYQRRYEEYLAERDARRNEN